MAGTAAYDWRFLPLTAKVLEKHKVTRRRAELQMKMGAFFPPEGHCLTEVGREVEGGNLTIHLAVVGGACHQEERTWRSASLLHTVVLAADDDDVFVTSVEKNIVKGAEIASLSSAAMVLDSERNILIFGGLNTTYMETCNEILKLTPVRNQYRSTLIKDPNHRCILPGDHVQDGDIPCVRFGHTLTRMGTSNRALLFGGLTMDQRHESLGRSFSQTSAPGCMYLLDMDTIHWTQVPTDMQSRAFHNAVYLPGTGQVLIISGMVYEGRGVKQTRTY